MTIPATVNDLPSLADALEAMGLKARKVRACLGCARPTENAGLYDTTCLDTDLPRFVCVTCASTVFRVAKAAEPAAASSWDAACEHGNNARAIRWQKLIACDWTQVPDAPLTSAQKTAWRVYRKALRDITETFASPDDVVWPVEPPQ